MATKLGVFNAALHEIGDAELSDTGDPVEAARVLVRRWDDVVADCLEAGSWNFATKTVEATADTGITPEFGYTEVFAKPSDWVRTHAVSDDENFTAPLLTFYDDVNYWSADVSPIYVRYVSNDTSFGLDLTRWTRAFARYVELELADRVCERLSQNGSKKEAIARDRDKARAVALNRDTMNEAQPKFAPVGSWTRSRGGGRSRERGNRGSLTG